MKKFIGHVSLPETENYCPKDLVSSDKERNGRGSRSDEDVEIKQRGRGSTHSYG